MAAHLAAGSFGSRIPLKAIVVRNHGGPEVLEVSELPLPEPGDGEVRVRIKAIGVNRRDAFMRSGIYQRTLPLTPGIEAAGVVDATDAGVGGWGIGNRVVYYVPDTLGAYAEYQVVEFAEVPEIAGAKID